jgi:hypothetical protein
MAVTTLTFKKFEAFKKHHVNIFCTVFLAYHLTNMETADIRVNSFELFNKTGSVRINGNTEKRWGKHRCRGKSVCIIFSECSGIFFRGGRVSTNSVEDKGQSRTRVWGR